jgi:hypothetical protein
MISLFLIYSVGTESYKVHSLADVLYWKQLLLKHRLVDCRFLTGWDYVSELIPLTDILFISQMIYEYGERRWNDIDRGKPKKSEKNLSQCHFIKHKSHMDWRGREPGNPRWEVGEASTMGILTPLSVLFGSERVSARGKRTLRNWT